MIEISQCESAKNHCIERIYFGKGLIAIVVVAVHPVTTDQDILEAIIVQIPDHSLERNSSNIQSGRRCDINEGIISNILIQFTDHIMLGLEQVKIPIVVDISEICSPGLTSVCQSIPGRIFSVVAPLSLSITTSTQPS